MIYKVSYVVRDGKMPGGIKNEKQRPEIGSIVEIGHTQFTVTHVHEVMPARDNFQYLHAMVEPVSQYASVN